MILLRAIRKKPVNRVYCTSGQTVLEMREKFRFSQTNKSGEFITTRPDLEEMLKSVLQVEMKGC